MSRGLDRYISMSMGSGEESILSSSCFCRLSATAWMAFVHSSLQKTRKSCRITLLLQLSFVQWEFKKMYFRELEKCYHEFKQKSLYSKWTVLHTICSWIWQTNLSSGVSTWKVRSITVVHCRQRIIKVFVFGRSVFISWHSERIQEREKVCVQFGYFGVLKWG